MAKIKIFLEAGESIYSAEEALRKALNLHSSGDVHSSEKFEDSAVEDITQRVINAHSQIYKDMISEIIEELDKEYSNDNF